VEDVVQPVDPAELHRLLYAIREQTHRSTLQDAEDALPSWRTVFVATPTVACRSPSRQYRLRPWHVSDIRSSPHPDAAFESSLMPDAAQEYAKERELKIARIEGELEATITLLASLEANDEQHRRELEMARVEAATARLELEYEQRRALHQKTEDERRLAEAESRLAEAERGRREAERERGAVISALGRRARRRLDSSTDEKQQNEG
jgi:hypothetical protein